MSGPDPEPSDAELVRRFRDGDREAFGDLVRRHERRVYNVAYRMLGRVEEARDATQDVFLSCFRHLATFRGEAAFRTWLHRIAVNACYDVIRKRGPDPVAEPDSLEPQPTADHAERTAAAVDVQRALSAVPAEFRAVLVLHDLQDEPYDVIAQALGLPLGTVKSRLHRGRVALARALSGSPIESLGGEPSAMSAPSKPRYP